MQNFLRWNHNFIYIDNNIYFLGLYGLLILVLVSMQNKTPSEHEFTDLTEYIIKKKSQLNLLKNILKIEFSIAFEVIIYLHTAEHFITHFKIFVTVTNEIGEWS